MSVFCNLRLTFCQDDNGMNPTLIVTLPGDDDAAIFRIPILKSVVYPSMLFPGVQREIWGAPLGPSELDPSYHEKQLVVVAFPKCQDHCYMTLLGACCVRTQTDFTTFFSTVLPGTISKNKGVSYMLPMEVIGNSCVVSGNSCVFCRLDMVAWKSSILDSKSLGS